MTACVWLLSCFRCLGSANFIVDSYLVSLSLSKVLQCHGLVEAPRMQSRRQVLCRGFLLDEMCLVAHDWGVVPVVLGEREVCGGHADGGYQCGARRISVCMRIGCGTQSCASKVRAFAMHSVRLPWSSTPSLYSVKISSQHNSKRVLPPSCRGCMVKALQDVQYWSMTCDVS